MKHSATFIRTALLVPALEPGLREQVDYLRKELGVSASSQVATPDVGGVQLENLVFCASRPAGHMDYEAKVDATYKPDQMFLRNEIPLPTDASNGTYKVVITVTDKISSKTARVSTSFA